MMTKISLKALPLIFFSLYTICNVYAQRGYYDAPYERYEADQGVISNASVTPRSFSQPDLQSEASEQVCVNMSGSNASVEWTVSAPGDGLVVRYSVPDGQSATIDVYANNVYAGTMNLSTHYSWQYLWADNNPNNNGVSNTNPRMRFDETRLKLPMVIQAGQKLRLQRTGGNVHVDFAELELVPQAVSSGNGDYIYNGNGSNLQDVIDDNGGRTIYLPPGLYNVNRELYFGTNNTTLKGAGMWHTQIHFTNNNVRQGGLRADAYDISYSGLFLTTDRNSRSNSYKGINGVYTGGSVISDVWAEHFETGGWIAQFNSGPAYADGFLVTGCRFRNNYADGINLSKGTRNAIVEHCSFRNNGDDDMAIWSANNQECRDNTFRYNTSENCWRASGCAIYGGYNNKAHHLLIKDNLEVGLRVNNNFPGVGFNNAGLHEFYDITIMRCGTFNTLYNSPVGAIDLRCTETSGTRVQHVRFANIDIIDSKNDAIYFNHVDGDGFYDFTFENIAINGTGLEYPYNNVNGSGTPRGYGVRFVGYPGGYGTYCNLSFTNRGGSAGVWQDQSQQGSFNWSQTSGCASATVSIATPLANTTFGDCDNSIYIKVDAATSEGAISEVTCYIDGVEIGKENSDPYEFTWNNPSAGEHQISASATVTSSGNVTYSLERLIVVIPTVNEVISAPSIDGEIDDVWESHPSIPIDKVASGGGEIVSPSDFSASFKVAADATYLYVLVDVNDDNLIQDSPSTQTWNDDKVEIYIDYGNDKGTDYETGDHAYGFVYDNPIFYVGPGFAGGAQFSQKVKSGGYITEVRIPWSSIGGVPNYGDLMGFEVMVGDDDTGGDRDSKLVWTDETDNSWNNPSLFGVVRIAKAIQQQDEVCKGENYTFPDGVVEENIQSTISHKSTFVSSTGCDSLIVTKVEMYEVNVQVSQDAATLTASSNSGDYQWVDCGDNNAIIGETNQSFTPSENGNYAVEVTEDGCVDQSECIDVVNVSVGVSFFTQATLEIFPNPAHNAFVIRTDKASLFDLQIVATDGIVIREILKYQSGDPVDVSQLSGGVYFIKVQTEKGEEGLFRFTKI